MIFFHIEKGNERRFGKAVLTVETDTKGRILDHDTRFSTLVGRSREELYLRALNELRHEDMPSNICNVHHLRLENTPLFWRGIIKFKAGFDDYFWAKVFIRQAEYVRGMRSFVYILQSPSRREVKLAEKLYRRLA